MRLALLLATLGFAALASLDRGPLAQPTGMIMRRPDSLEWRPVPLQWFTAPSAPAANIAAEYSVVAGDPDRNASFVLRLRAGRGVVLPSHSHAVDVHVTVLSGTWCIGVGEKVDPKACQTLTAGAYVFIPKGLRHWVIIRNAVVQVSGRGPLRATAG